MTHAGEHCPGCLAPLDGGQHFCVACGLRVAPDELRLAALGVLSSAPLPGVAMAASGPRRPLVRSAGITAVVVLALGIGIGATIGPAAVGQTSAAQRSVVLLAGPPPPSPAALTTPVALSAPSGSPAVVDAVETLTTDTSASPAAAVAPEVAPEADAPAEPQGETPADPDADARAETPATPPPGSVQLAGVVVSVGGEGEGFALAARDGRLLAVHAEGCGVALGDGLHLRAHPLANGTWSADRVRRVGAGVRSVSVAGMVEWVDPATGRYALGARGTTPLVSAPAAVPVAPPAPPAPTSAPAADAAPPVDPAAVPSPTPVPAPPTLGASLRVRLDLVPTADGQPAALVERVRRDAPPAPDPAPLELAGTLASVDAQVRTLVLALDDATPPSASVTLTVPPTVDLGLLTSSLRVAVSATAALDGTYALTGVSPDGDANVADDATTLQGDQAPAAPPDNTTVTTGSACTPLDAAPLRRSSARSRAAG